AAEHRAVAGAARRVARGARLDLLARRIRVLGQDLRGAQEHARRAVAALQALLLPERLLQRVHRAVGERLDGRDLLAVGLDGERDAGADRLAVHEDGARPADAVLAADVRADEVEVLAQEVDEQGPRLDVALVADPVDGGRDPHDAPPRARASARSTQARATRRREGGAPRTVSVGVRPAR